MQTLKRQHGGTIVGIIIGLIIGLGIALAVAMVITKTPLPFTDKSGKQSKAEPTPNQSADPNKPLYGNKTAAREAAKEFIKEPPAESATDAATSTDEKKSETKDNKAPVVEQTAASDKPKKPDVKTPEAGKDAATKVDEDKWNYYLQAGAFREQPDAEAIRAKLALIGVEARISERPSENGTLYRVRVGPFGQLEAMNKARGKLSDNGVDVAVVRISK